MAVAAGLSQWPTTEIAETFLDLSSVQRRVFATHLSNQNKLGAKEGRDRQPFVPQCFKMCLGCFLEIERCFDFTRSPCVATGQGRTLSNPDSILILPEVELVHVYQHATPFGRGKVVGRVVIINLDRDSVLIYVAIRLNTRAKSRCQERRSRVAEFRTGTASAVACRTASRLSRELSTSRPPTRFPIRWFPILE